MTTTRIQNVAFFKIRSTNSIPPRPGPVQCIRNCTNCILRTSDDTKVVDCEELLGIMSFDNLVTRKSLWLFKYQSLQYHVGQIDLLKNSLKSGAPLTIYIVAATSVNDLSLINTIFNHVQVEDPHLLDMKTAESDICEILKTLKTIVLPIKWRSCVQDRFALEFTKDNPCLGPRQLMTLLEPLIGKVLDDKNFDLNIVPVIVTKDHDNLTLFGLGSACIQISEPYKLSAYLKAKQTTQKSTHLVQHIYYDAAHSAAILPTHLVAFLILYLEQENGIELSTLVDYIDWFRRVSIDTGMHIGFTGSSLKAAKFGLMVLDNFVQYTSAKYYSAKDVESLMDYADLVTPVIAYYGLIARAILIVYNEGKAVDTQLRSLAHGTRIRVMEDRVKETSQMLAEKLERRIPCRRPCTTIERCVEDTITQMANFGRYFKIEEPQICMVNRSRRWAGDSDDEDEEYFRRNRDNPAFKSWIVLNERDYRRNRLNLFMNSISLPLLQ